MARKWTARLDQLDAEAPPAPDTEPDPMHRLALDPDTDQEVLATFLRWWTELIDYWNTHTPYDEQPDRLIYVARWVGMIMDAVTAGETLTMPDLWAMERYRMPWPDVPDGSYLSPRSVLDRHHLEESAVKAKPCPPGFAEVIEEHLPGRRAG